MKQASDERQPPAGWQGAVLCLTVTLMLAACVGDPALRKAIADAASNPRPAIPKLRPFAEAGDAAAIQQLCIAYGRSLDSSVQSAERVRAFRWCQAASEGGSADAQFHLGNFFAWGIGTAQDRTAALRWYREAASRGHAGAEDAARALEGKPAICRHPITGCRLM